MHTYFMKYPGQIYTEKTVVIYLKFMLNQAPCVLSRSQPWLLEVLMCLK